MAPDTTADRQILSEPSRQSPLALVFIAWRFFRQFQTIGIGAVVLLFTGRLSGPLLAAAIALAGIAVVFSVLAWWRYVFQVEGDELVVSKGLLAVERLSIPLNRVQSASIEQKFLHRPVGLVSVAIDTAGSSDAEFEIDAIPRAKAEALQRLVSMSSRTNRSARVDGAAEGTESTSSIAGPIDSLGPNPGVEEVVLQRTWKDLVRIGLARWPWAGFIAFVPLVTVADDLFDFVEIDFDEQNLPVEPRLEPGFFLQIATALLAVTALGAALQVGRQFLSNWDLTLSLTGNGLRRTAGLFNKTSRASSLTRIQSLKIHQSVLHRLFKIRKVQLSTIGEGDLQIPGSHRDEITRLRQLAFSSSTEPSLDRSVSPIMILREVRLVSLMVIGGFIGLTIADAPRWWWLITLAIPIQMAASYRKWKKRRWSYSPGRMAEFQSFLNVDSTEIQPFKAQTVAVEQSVFERRRGLATITVRLAEGRLSIPLIDEHEARRIRDSILYQAETDPRAWM